MRVIRSSLAISILAAALWSVPAAAGEKVFASDCGTGRQRPGHFVIYCGDAGQYLWRLKWSSWGGRVASARGTLATKTCDPFCAAGGVTNESVTVHFFYKRHCPGHRFRFYTRGTVFRSNGRNLRLRFGCPS